MATCYYNRIILLCLLLPRDSGSREKFPMISTATYIFYLGRESYKPSQTSRILYEVSLNIFPSREQQALRFEILIRVLHQVLWDIGVQNVVHWIRVQWSSCAVGPYWRLWRTVWGGVGHGSTTSDVFGIVPDASHFSLLLEDGDFGERFLGEEEFCSCTCVRCDL